MRVRTLTWILIAAAIAAVPANAANRLIPFQARLTDTSNEPLNGVFEVVFVIYDAPLGGTALWAETHATASVIEGQLNVLLGGIVNLDDPDDDGNNSDAVQFTQPKYLGITVGAPGQEMVPRHQLVPAFHAVTADIALSLPPGLVGSAEIASDAVGATEIASDAVGATEIATDAVGASEIATNAVGAPEIVDGSVGQAEIATDGVGAAEIAEDAVWSSDIKDGQVTHDDIATDAVRAPEIMEGAVWSSEIRDGQVTHDDIATNAVRAPEIAADAVWSSEIRDGQVTHNDIASSAVRGAEIATIRVVSVECNSECSDSTLSQICNATGSGYEAIAVDCQSVDSDSSNAHVACGGDNRCYVNAIFSSAPLSSFCDDTSGWDAQVYCISTN